MTLRRRVRYGQHNVRHGIEFPPTEVTLLRANQSPNVLYTLRRPRIEPQFDCVCIQSLILGECFRGSRWNRLRRILIDITGISHEGWTR